MGIIIKDGIQYGRINPSGLDGTDHVIWTDHTQNLTDEQKNTARGNIGAVAVNQGNGNAGKALVVGQNGMVAPGDVGVTNAIKRALLDMFEHVAFIDDSGSALYNALYNALYAEGARLTSIEATIAQGYEPVCTTDALELIRRYMTVTARFSNGIEIEVDGYTLSGALTAGTATITVQYMGKTDTVQVEVTQLPTGYTHRECVVANGTQAILSGLYETDMQGLGVVLKEMRVDTADRTGHILSSPSFFVPFLWSNDSTIRNVNNNRFGNQFNVPGGNHWEINQAYTIEAFINGNEVKLDGETMYEVAAGTTMSASNQLIFLAYSGNATEFPERFRFTGKFYYLKLFRGSALVHSFIPCTNSGGVTGLYDAIDGRFLAPAIGTLAWE